MTNKDNAHLIYAKHIALASTDGRLFRKTVMDEISPYFTCKASSAMFYSPPKVSKDARALQWIRNYSK